MEKIKYVLFDCWDTIINYSEIYNGAVIKKIYDHVINKQDMSFNEFATHFMEFYTDYENRAPFDVYQESFINLLCTYYDLKLDCSLTQASIDSSLGFKADLVEDIDLFLNFLKENNIKCSILSNTIHNKEITKNLVGRNFKDFPFEHVICSCEYVLRKPDPRIYILASKIVKVEPKNIAFIGDNFYTDIIGASKANMQPFHLNKKNQEIDSKLKDEITYIEFKNYKELISIFKGKI